MVYKYLESVHKQDITQLPLSSVIDNFVLQSHQTDIGKALDFFNTDEKILYVHGFLGTGKRQFINYISGFLNKDVIKLEYYCKPATVCDDILLTFIDIIEKNSISKAVNHSVKVSTLMVKFQNYISSIHKPFVIFLHSFDDVSSSNISLISECINTVLKNNNIKIVVSTRAMLQEIFGERKYDRKIILKQFPKDIFHKFLENHNITGTEEAINDFYKLSRGYYYYTALTIKIIQSMKLTLSDFLAKYAMSGISFDEYLGATYINLLPNTIRNFFWFLRTIRHGISLNALAILGLYDDFSIDYLKKNLMIYLANDIIYVQDYFQQDIDISIPTNVEIKLHKYIIGIYEKELREPLQTRSLYMSRQSLRAEIEYHSQLISKLENRVAQERIAASIPQAQTTTVIPNNTEVVQVKDDITQQISHIKQLKEAKQYTEAIELVLKIIEQDAPDANTLAELRVELGRLYHIVNDLAKSQHYYELAAKYYKDKSEVMNLNYLNYELTSLYFDMYKLDRAITTIKNVIYSVDTPQSLMVDACTILGNIYSHIKKSDEALKYYRKALESIDETTHPDGIAELYFKYALMCDEQNDMNTAFEYYNKCLILKDNNPFKALAYSNMASSYFENDNFSDAEDCFLKAYTIDKTNNNYDGIYYNASYLAKIYLKQNSSKALEYLLEAKRGAEFINEGFYILETTVALGDYYYNHKEQVKLALEEYFKALKIAKSSGDMVDASKIEARLNDMKKRIDEKIYKLVEKQYG